MDIKPGQTEFSVGIDLEHDEKFLVDYRASGERIEVKNLRAFIDMATGKVNSVVAYGLGIKPDGRVGGGRSRKLPYNLIPQVVVEAIHNAWDEAAEAVSDVEGLSY